ncbi:MAG: diaminopimelate epimerase [Gemmatimonadota bacterium]|nr:diaminopimelate epimerase [Gemmatimonadota bacterium]
MTAVKGRRFWKMSGSGNDFVFFDGRTDSVQGLDLPDAIRRICSRTRGVGADGVVFLEASASEPFGIRYYNSDGSRGELCGNASLCTSSLAVKLGLVAEDGFQFSTDVGSLRARLASGEPEIDLQAPRGLRANAGMALEAGEARIGFVDTGVPHLVVLTADADQAPVVRRGAELRRHASLPAGANVNFLSPAGAEWRMRTYERGVEGETLACGTGAVACAVLLRDWGLATGYATRLRTSSGLLLTVTIATGADGAIRPSLRGEGRIVFEGELVDL